MYLRSLNVTVLEVWPDIFVVQGAAIKGYPALRTHVATQHGGFAIRILTQDLLPDDVLAAKRALPEVVALRQE